MRRLLWSVIIGLVVIIGALGVSFHKHDAATTYSGPSIQTPMGDISIGAPKFPNIGLGALTQPTTVLFMGVDVTYSGQGRNLLADKTALNGRSDTMMLVFLNPPQNKVSVLHIPRDTEANVGRYGVQKINSANALGGPEQAKAAVTDLLGIPVDHFVVMNLQGLVQLVNELGGVTVEVPKKMTYMDWTAKLKIDLDPGWHTLTGNQSMGFVRFRHDDLGDIGRVQRQQVFLQAAERKMLDPRSWVHVPACIDIAMKNMNTDLSQVDLFQALNFVHGVPKSNIKFVMLPGQFSGNGDWIATSDARTLAWQLVNPEQEVAMSRRNIAVMIKNASSDSTMGSKLATALRKIGYVTSIGKDEKDSIYKQSRIIVQNGNIANGKMMQSDLGGVGEVIPASVGDLYSKITIIACDDLKLESIVMSTPDAPYAVPVTPTPLITPMPIHIIGKHGKRPSQSASETEIVDPNGVETTVSDVTRIPDGSAGVTPENGEPVVSPTPTTAPGPDAVEAKPSYTPTNASPSYPSSGYIPPTSSYQPSVASPSTTRSQPQDAAPISAPVPGVQDSSDTVNK